MRSWTAPLLISLLASGAAAAPIPLTSAAQLQALCSELRPQAVGSPVGHPPDAADGISDPRRSPAQDAELDVRLPGGQFAVARIDAQSGILTIDTQHGFRLFDGRAVLYPVDEDDLELTPGEGQPAPAGAGSLTLQLVVRPGEDRERVCSVGPNRSVALEVEILQAALLDPAGHRVASMEYGEGSDRPAAPGGKPQVEVDSARVDGAAGVEDQLTQALLKLQPRFLSCFEHALQKNPELDGVLVLGFDLGRDGRPGPITVVADSVQDDGMVPCVVDLVKGTGVPPRPAPGEAKSRRGRSAGVLGQASVTLRFERK